ncbi:hypothetical protein L1887_13860 [Cichorium endivia]|nr:hypothetical protein L1887_13860 [Cichorium endivia]
MVCSELEEEVFQFPIQWDTETIQRNTPGEVQVHLSPNQEHETQTQKVEPNIGRDMGSENSNSCLNDGLKIESEASKEKENARSDNGLDTNLESVESLEDFNEDVRQLRETGRSVS